MASPDLPDHGPDSHSLQEDASATPQSAWFFAWLKSAGLYLGAVTAYLATATALFAAWKKYVAPEGEGADITNWALALVLALPLLLAFLFNLLPSLRRRRERNLRPTATAGAGTPPYSYDEDFTWTAPPCTGPVSIVLLADDVPDPMQNVCPDSSSERDDPYIVRSGTSTVSLPQGCSTGTKSAIFTASKVAPTPCPKIIECGCIENPRNHDFVIEAAYNSCKWSFQVTMGADVPCGPCTSNYINIKNGNEPELTEENYCAVVEAFTTDSGCVQWMDDTFSNTECVTMHEDEHYKILEEQLAIHRVIFLSKRSMNDMPIDCSDPDTTTCQAARAARILAIVSDAVDAYDHAFQAMVAEGDERPIQAARPCFTAIADSICDHATSQGWESCDYCP